MPSGLRVIAESTNQLLEGLHAVFRQYLVGDQVNPAVGIAA
jgi:hypothetical protein